MSDNVPPGVESDKWCRTTRGDTARTSFSWTIEGFKDRPEKFDEFTDSAEFTVTGPEDQITRWNLTLCPRGFKCGDEDYRDEVGVFLEQIDDFPVKAEFSLSIRDSMNQKKCTTEFDMHLFEGHDNFGACKLITFDDLIDRPDLLPSGNLTIICELTVFGPEKILSGSKYPEENIKPQDNCLQQMSQHFASALNDNRFSDVKIKCGERVFECHQLILSLRSPVFQAMFEADMREKRDREVSVQNIRPEVIAEMLHFIYSGSISNGNEFDEVASELLGAADQYQLELLKNICEDKLCLKLEVSNSIEFLVLGDLHQASNLKKMALRLVAKNICSIVNTDVYMSFHKDHPLLSLEVTKVITQKTGVKRKRENE